MDSIYSKHKPGSTDDLYIKLLDGDKIKGRVTSEPAISVYQEGQKPRYSWVVFVRDKNGKVINRPQILTKGISVYKGIADLVEEWGLPQTFDVAIKRTGSGPNDTEYNVTPVKVSSDLTDSQQEEVDKIDLPKAIGGKWLADFVEDGELPAPKVDGIVADEVVEMPSDDKISLSEIPF